MITMGFAFSTADSIFFIKYKWLNVCKRFVEATQWKVEQQNFDRNCQSCDIVFTVKCLSEQKKII